MKFVCPLPMQWNNIYLALKSAWETSGRPGDGPPVPLILNGWAFSSDFDKHRRWQNTLEWANQHGLAYLTPELSDAEKYLVAKEGISKNKTAHYDIRIPDKPLIEAARRLGEWLATRPETTAAQQSAIACMLSFIDRLPSPPEPGLNVEFSVEIQPNDCNQPNAIVREWFVSVCRGGFEIGSIYTPYPGDDRRRDPISESEHELSWELCPGEHNCNSSFYVQEWISEVSDIASIVPPDHYLIVDADIWNTID